MSESSCFSYKTTESSCFSYSLKKARLEGIEPPQKIFKTTINSLLLKNGVSISFPLQ